MAREYLGPDSFVYKRAKQHGYYYLFMFFFPVVGLYLIVILLNQIYAHQDIKLIALFTGLYSLALFGIYKLFKYTFLTDTFIMGMGGEWSIAQELKKLSDSYFFLRNVKITGTNYDVDFVVVGPTGIFAIDAKSQRGKIEYINGVLLKNGKAFEKPVLWQVKHEALFVKKLILEKFNKNLSVVPVLAFSSFWAKMRFGFNPVDNAFIVQKRFLLKLITDRPVFNYPMDRKLIEQELEKFIFKEIPMNDHVYVCCEINQSRFKRWLKSVLP